MLEAKPHLVTSLAVTLRARKFAVQTFEQHSLRLLIVLLSLVALFLFNQSSGASTASAATAAKTRPLYSCGASNNSIRCYATVEWNGNVTGAQTWIFTNRIYGGNCFVQNTLWLADSTDSYWVEAGIRAIVTPNGNQDSLFWGDNRPTYGWSPHYGNPLTSNDHGKYSHVSIEHLSTEAQGVWSVIINGLPDSNLPGTSTQNYFNGYHIEIGMELCGSTNASAPHNGFTNNVWINGSSSGYQHRIEDRQTIQFPTDGYWTQAPNYSNGGVWTTCILGNGC